MLFTFFATILQSSDIQHEQLFIYKSFEEGINFMPSIFPITFSVLPKKMEQVITSTQSKEIMASVLSIMDSIYTHKLDSSNSVPKEILESYLASIGFNGLPNCDQFHARKNETIKPVIIDLLNAALQDP